MIYSEMTRKAMRLCYEAHREQNDKSGVPYVFHPMHVAEQMTSEDSVCAALLHDVIEDCNITAKDLEERGFSAAVIDAVVLLTHKNEVPYMEYVEKIAENPIAKEVKMADLKHNMDLTRLIDPTEKDLKRVEKYKRALSLLEKGERNGI